MRFTTKLILANALFIGASLMVPGFQPFAKTPVWPAVILGYFGLTWLLNRWIQKAATGSPVRFIAAVNGATAIKLFTSLAVVTAYLVLVGGEFRVQFALGMFAAFALNTTLLVVESQKLPT